MRILLYAINGAGLGHVARLSAVLNHIISVDAEIQAFFYSNSRFASQLLGVPGDTVLLPESLPPSTRASFAYQGFERAVIRYRPHIVVCDTHWPIPAISVLRARNVRTVLILRLVAVERAELLLKQAHRDFDLIIVPHSADEVESLYAPYPNIMRLLVRPNVFVAGPIARRPVRHTVVGTPIDVLFTLGGGGEYFGANSSNSIASFVSAFRDTADLLSSNGLRPHIARGPLLAHPIAETASWSTLETLDLPSVIDECTMVVGRAGYNTCWEVLAAGGRLVLVGDHAGYEDVSERVRYLASRELAVPATVSADSITRIVLEQKAIGWDSKNIRSRASVNLGLPSCVRRILHD